MSIDITLRQLEYFVATARAQSMAVAAMSLHVSPAAVSLGIHQLEQSLGMQLFIRIRHQPLALTAAGRELLADAVTTIALVEDVQAKAVDRIQELSGNLHFGCFTTLAPFVLPRLVAEISRLHPKLLLETQEATLDELQNRILDGSIEVALIYGLDLRPGIKVESVGESFPYVLLPTNHRFANRKSIRLKDLANDPMILLDAPPSRHHALAVLGEFGIRPNIARVTLNFETARSFVASGHGWGFLVQRPYGDESYEGIPLVVVQIQDAVEPVSIVVASAAGAPASRRVTICTEICKTILQRNQ